MKKHILIMLDRDGTIHKDVGYLGKEKYWKEQIEMYEVVFPGIRELKQIQNTRIVACTNQAGVARGFFDCKRVEEVNAEIERRLKEKGCGLDGWYFCPYVDLEYAEKKNISLFSDWVIKNPRCRKPNIGMLEEASEDFGILLDETNIYVIGDKESDVQTAINAGGKGFLVNMEKNPEEFLRICREINNNTKI